jgi:uncharacterized protein (TIGR02270 family)
LSSDARKPDSREGYVAPILVDVVREHLDEVTFLSVQRRKLLFSTDIPLSGLRRHDERIVAHWDGLVVGLPSSLELAWERIAGDDPWDVFAAVRVWLELGHPAPESVVEHLNKAGEETVPGWFEAFRRTSVDRLTTLFPEGPTGTEAPRITALLVDAWGWHGLLSGLRLTEIARNEDTSVRRTLARAMGWIRRSASVDAVLQRLLADPEKEVYRAALWSVALHRPPEGAAMCRAAVRSGAADPFAVRLLGLLGGPEDVESVAHFLDDADAAPAAARALGDLGFSSAVDHLIGLLDREEEQLREAADDGIRTILGDLPDTPREHLPGELPPEEETVDPEQLRAWWVEAGNRFDGRKRWLRGKPFPWDGAPEFETMEALWRSALQSAGGLHDWLRREVPDGFFSARPVTESRPGE